MSMEGLKLFGQSLFELQSTRNKLLHRCTMAPTVDKTDMRLAQMLDEMKDGVKEEFARLTLSGFGK